ncbi:MAG: hypothetical protein LC687_00820 [Actinobacteria bacterium]|nr:hypothetical protein [Actinomycetota bacterium]MCA1806398.1 hypothetical protein [Actinomycetota bacterium]
MTERQAQQEGLRYTGIWERPWNSDKAKERAAEIRKKYNCRAVMVSQGRGVSVYAEPAYGIKQQAESAQRILENVQARKDAAYASYLKEVENIEAIAEDARQKIAKAQELK